MGDPMKLRVCFMLAVTISFLILSPSIFSCVATVPPEDEPKTSSLKKASSFQDPPYVQTPDQEGIWWGGFDEGGADTKIGGLELASDDPPRRSRCESEPYRRESEEAKASRDSEVVSTSCPRSRESAEVALASTTTPRGRESELAAVDSTGHSSTPDSSPSSRELELASASTRRRIPQSSDLASASTPLSSPESELASPSSPCSSESELACHLNEATPVDFIPPQNLPPPTAPFPNPSHSLSHNYINIQSEPPPPEPTLTLSTDYHAIHIDTEEVDSFRNPSLIGRQPGGQDQDLGRAVLAYVVPVNLVLISRGVGLTTILLQPPAPSFQDPSDNIPGSDLIPHHAIQVYPPQQPRITSTSTITSSGDDQLGIAIRSIAAVYRNEGLGRAVLGYVVPVTLGILTMNTRPSSTVVNLVLISMVVGFAAIWYGLLLRIAFPRFANRIELFGVAHVLASFFGLLSTYLPPSLAWLPWLCWALAIAPFTLTFSTSHQSRTTSGPE